MIASGNLQDLGEHASGTHRIRLFRRYLAAALKGLLPSQHGVVSVLPGFALGQFGGRHVAPGDVMTVARRWVGDPGNVLVASH